MSSRNLVRPSLPPPLAVSQHQASSNAQASIAQLQLTPQQQMHQQMLLQVRKLLLIRTKELLTCYFRRFLFNNR